MTLTFLVTSRCSSHLSITKYSMSGIFDLFVVFLGISVLLCPAILAIAANANYPLLFLHPNTLLLLLQLETYETYDFLWSRGFFPGKELQDSGCLDQK